MLDFFRRKAKTPERLEELSDEELMVRYREGAMRPFEVLLERHRQPVFNFVYRFVRDREQAEDLLQEVFVRLVRNAAEYEPKAKFTTWMYTIARNLAIDSLRRGKLRRTISLDQPRRGRDGEDEGTLYELLPGAMQASDGQLADRQFAAALYRALDELPPEQREVFLLRECQSLPFQEIAEVVGVPLNTVKSRMRYALEGLRRRLSDHGVAAEGQTAMAGAVTQ